MSFLKPSLLNQDIQTQNNELCWEKTEVENQTNENVSRDKIVNNNYGSNFSQEIKEYIDKRIDEKFEEKFEEIKANFIPKTAKPKLSIVQHATAIDMHLFLCNSGNLDADIVSIKIPEEEMKKLLDKGWKESDLRECFEKNSFTLRSGNSCEIAAYHGRAWEPLKPRPFKFLLTYKYRDNNGKQQEKEEFLSPHIGTFTDR